MTYNQPAAQEEDHRAQLQQRIAEELASIPPLVFRIIRSKVIKTALSDFKAGMTPLHYEIIRLLEDEDSLHCSEIGRRLHIAKAQMTGLIDKLVSNGMVERSTDDTDRRMIRVRLTANGKAFLKDQKMSVTNAISMAMMGLSEKELTELSVSINKIRDFLSELK